jgi:hypothetical protein
MYDDLGNQTLIVVLFNYNTQNIQVKYCTILCFQIFTQSAFYDVDATSAQS